MAIIGIDLGTTNSLAAVYRNGEAELIPNTAGSYLTPSVVALDDNGQILTGMAAREWMLQYPQNGAANFKRYMGTNHVFQLGSKKFTAEELSSFILRRLKEDAERYLGEPVEEAVVSVPAYFDDHGRNATRLAGELAGLKVERIVNEPSAAALLYHLEKQEDETFLVFDFGGGTLDISIVDAFDNVIDILAVSGDNKLGGMEFNQAIVQYCTREHQLRLPTNFNYEQALHAAEQCKIALTSKEEAVMQMEVDGVSYTSTLTNQQLIDCSADIFRRVRAVIAQALRDCNVSFDEITQIIPVGGSSKMPVVQQFLQQLLGRNLQLDYNPDTIVALGVGLVAGMKEKHDNLRQIVLSDICPFSLGTDILNEGDPSRSYFHPIIERNTSLPCKKMQRYYTVRNYQKHIEVSVYQGEHLYADENKLLGKVRLAVPAKPKGEESISVTFLYDLNGILQVEVTVDSTGKQAELTILNPQLQLKPEELQRRTEQLKRYSFAPAEQAENKAILERMQRLYINSTGITRQLLEEQTAYFQMLLEHGTKRQILRKRIELQKLFDSMEQQVDEEKLFELFRKPRWSDEEDWEEIEASEGWFDDDVEHTWH